MPVFSHGSLRLYLLALLEEGPKHGYDIIKDLGGRFGGTYAPSAGTVYPRLAKLAQEGLVATEADGRRIRYRLTGAGRAELAARAVEVDGIEAEISASVRRLADELRADIRQSMRDIKAQMAAGTEPALARARRSPSAGSAADPAVLTELEYLVTEFRNDVRLDLRRAGSGGGVSELTAATVRTVLEQAKASIRASLAAAG